MKLDYPNINRITLMSKEFMDIIENNKVHTQNRVSRLYAQGFKEIPT